MDTHDIDSAKANILNSIHDLTKIAKERTDARMVSKLAAQADILEGLDQRIKQSQLPERYIRSIINDVRLEVLLILAGMKVTLTFEKHDIIAPTLGLKKEAHDRLITLSDEDSMTLENGDLSAVEKLQRITNNLKVISSVEHILHKYFLREEL